MFQQNQLEDVRTNITVWLTSLAIQVNKLKKLNHVLDEEYQITHILASLPREYSSVVERVKIDRRTSSTLITMDETKKRLEEHYLQLKREHGWSEDEMALNMKSSNNQSRNIKKGNKVKFFKGRCNMEEGHEQNKEWEKFWWTVDEDMFTYVMNSKIEELINEKLSQALREEVEIRENQDFDSEEEMISETEETDDDESETSNANVNNYLDSAIWQ